MVNTEITLIIFFAAKDGETLYSQQKQDQKPTVAQIMNSLLQNSGLNLRKQGKPLGQIPYNYTVEVRNRFMGLDRTDRVPDELLMEVRDIVQEAVDQDRPQEEEMQKSKMAV